jgi:hypothetical protein
LFDTAEREAQVRIAENGDPQPVAGSAAQQSEKHLV